MSWKSATGGLREMLYWEYARPKAMTNLPDYRTITTLEGCIKSGTDTAANEVRALLQGKKSTGTTSQFDPRVTPIRRVEIFCNEHTRSAYGYLLDRGLVLFDSTNRPVVHVFHALIGYDGSAPQLTKEILGMLAIPDVLFEEIQAEFKGIRELDIPYYVAIQASGNDDSPIWEWSSITHNT